jgi:hypothetical protein
VNSFYQLFVFDLDGTLLSPAGIIPLETKTFLHRLLERGRITLATGRSLASAQPYIKELAIATPVILYHGAVVIDPLTDRPLWEKRIPERLTHRILTVSQRFPVHTQLYRASNDPKVYVSEVTPPIQAFIRKEDLSACVVKNLEDLISQGALKLLFIGNPEVLPAVGEAINREVPEISVVRSEREYLEALPSGVSKGEALTWLCASLGVPLERVVAVGDQLSDLSMIEQAGLGVAMAHAPAGLLSHADLTIPQLPDLELSLGA